jgi:methylenetetrahydrofolate reductase (NADPH)
MKITDIFKTDKRTFSFEFFPPKDEISAVDFGVNVGQLIKLAPSFVSVTYGAGGSTQERTFALVNYLQNRIGLNVMAHYTCVGASRDKVKTDIAALKSASVDNLMLLRGDPPKGSAVFTPAPEGFAHASQLVETVRREFGDAFAVGGACYPEKHPEAKDLQADVANLRKKIDAGVDFLITQLFFDNSVYFSFVECARAAGINCRIIPGIIPLVSYSQIERFATLSGTRLPQEFRDRLESVRDNPRKVRQTGVDYAIAQCKRLLSAGAPGIHFYTLNKSGATVEIYEELKLSSCLEGIIY